MNDQASAHIPDRPNAWDPTPTYEKIAATIAANWPLARTGIAVGCKRWPYSASHPDCWLPPLVGVVMDLDDPLVWTDTMTFYGRPERPEVRDHVVSVSRLIEWDCVPVLWTNHEGRRIVQWQAASELTDPQKDHLKWKQARFEAYQRC